MDHLRNAKKYFTRDGTSLFKGGRESAKKIDLAVCAVGARMLRRLVLNRGEEEAPAKKQGRLWGVDSRDASQASVDEIAEILGLPSLTRR